LFVRSVSFLALPFSPDSQSKILSADVLCTYAQFCALPHMQHKKGRPAPIRSNLSIFLLFMAINASVYLSLSSRCKFDSWQRRLPAYLTVLFCEAKTILQLTFTKIINALSISWRATVTWPTICFQYNRRRTEDLTVRSSAT